MKKTKTVHLIALVILTGAIWLITLYLCMLHNFFLSLQVKLYKLYNSKHCGTGYICMQH